MSITRINEFKAAADKADELYEFLKSLDTYISASQGCISYQVLRGIDENNSFVAIEIWDSVEDHKKSIANFPKEDMQAAMNLFAAPPKGNYYA